MKKIIKFTVLWIFPPIVFFYLFKHSIWDIIRLEPENCPSASDAIVFFGAAFTPGATLFSLITMAIKRTTNISYWYYIQFFIISAAMVIALYVTFFSNGYLTGSGGISFLLLLGILIHRIKTI